jgi:hypothetical protein
VDSHGQSTVAFAFCRLLGFQLMPRLKAIHAQKLSRPDVGKPDAYSNLQAILTKPIDCELIRQQYDQMVKYVTAARLDTAETESILRRFVRSNIQHPTYKALSELALLSLGKLEHLLDDQLEFTWAAFQRIPQHPQMQRRRLCRSLTGVRRVIVYAYRHNIKDLSLRLFQNSVRFALERINLRRFPFVHDGTRALRRAIAKILLDLGTSLLHDRLKLRLQLSNPQAFSIMKLRDIITLQVCEK